MKRPLLLVGLLYVAGILAGEYLPFVPIGLLWLLAGILLVTLVWPQGRSTLLYAGVFIAGSANVTLQESALSPNDLRNIVAEEPQIITVRGVLIETPMVHQYETGGRTGWTTQARLDVSALKRDRGEWRPALGRIILSTPAQITNSFAGESVEVSGVLERPPRATAEG